MSHRIVVCETTHLNVSPTGFRISAKDYFRFYLDFKSNRDLSPIRYFLCCRSIELALKALHLEKMSQKEVKDLYYHDLNKAYEGLDDDQKTLTDEELGLLRSANDIYKAKDFEYFNFIDAATANNRFPDLEKLAQLARKITDYDS